MRRLAVVIITVLAVMWVLARIAGNEQVKDSPPPACQLLGGQWDIWDGWTCG